MVFLASPLYATSPQQPVEKQHKINILSPEQKMGALTDLILILLAATGGTLILLSNNGVNLGAISGIGTLGNHTAIILLGSAGGVVFGDLIGYSIISTQAANKLFAANEKLADEPRFAALNEVIVDERTEKDTLAGKLRQANEAITRAENKLIAAKKENSRLQGNITHLEGLQVEITNTEQAKTQKVKVALEQKIQMQEAVINTLRKQMASNASPDAKAKAMLTKFENEIAALQLQLKYSASIEELHNEMEKGGRALNQLKFEQCKAEKLHKELSQKCTSLLQEIKDIEEDHRNLNGEHSKLEANHQKLSSQQQKLIEENRLAIKDNQRLADTKRDAEEELDDLEVQRNGLEKKLTALQDELNDASAKRDELAGLISEGKTTIAQNKAALDGLLEDIRRAEEELNRLNTRAQKTISDADSQAQVIVKGAREQATEINNQAQQNADGIRQQATNEAGIEAQKIRDNATGEANGIKQQATTEADGIKQQAAQEADGVKNQAQVDANEIRQRATTDADTIKQQAAQLQNDELVQLRAANQQLTHNNQQWSAHDQQQAIKIGNLEQEVLGLRQQIQAQPPAPPLHVAENPQPREPVDDPIDKSDDDQGN